MASKMPSSACEKPCVVAGDQFGIVEIVAGIHLDGLVEPAAHVDLALLVEQRDFDAVDLGGVGVDDADRDIHRLVEVRRAPVIRQRRIEHVAEPVDDHGLADLRQHAVIDLGVIVGVAAEFCQRARSHQDDAAAGLFDRRDLLLIGADHVVDGFRILHREVIGAGAGKHQRVAPRLGRPHRALDQFQRGRPVQPHAALRGVHRLRRRRGRGPRRARGTQWSCPSRSRPSATDRHRRADRPPHAPRRTPRGSACLRASPEKSATPPGDRSRCERSAVGNFSDSEEIGNTGLFMAFILTP